MTAFTIIGAGFVIGKICKGLLGPPNKLWGQVVGPLLLRNFACVHDPLECDEIRLNIILLCQWHQFYFRASIFCISWIRFSVSFFLAARSAANSSSRLCRSSMSICIIYSMLLIVSSISGISSSLYFFPERVDIRYRRSCSQMWSYDNRIPPLPHNVRVKCSSSQAKHHETKR